MEEIRVLQALIGLVCISALVTAGLLLFVTAPYGRHARAGWGPAIPSRTGWIVMESPAVALFAIIYFNGTHCFAPVPLLLFGLWQFHYIYRTCIYPLRIRNPSKPMPVLIAGMAFVFQVLNSYINARWISEFGATHSFSMLGFTTLAGLVLFFAGWLLNHHSDQVLLNLRKPGETGYKIPFGGGFRFVSSPNYLGELLEWCGWALISWSWAGASFAIFTAANLIPRAMRHHKWLHGKFANYPKTRRAILPFIL